ncbi:prostate-associated microseminoprotein [Zootoca vivipara]|uniref:prostate-associated microseminoprotein n=1 Tax=Zootoca vivipara TaxID=8524 RepID=UPI0015907A07|nr:prostate-associated microseminoprotein [Zootoca vivipara]
MAAKARLGAAAALGAPLRGCLLLALLLQLTGARALCYFHAQAPCLYKEKHFGPGESWQDANCSKCFCLDPLGVGCCDMMQPPVDFPAWCEARYDFRACKISLVQKAGLRLPCVNNLEPGWGSGQAPEQPGSRGGAKARLGRQSLEAKR